MKTNGAILHETDQYVVIATGLSRESKNTKTGDMVQLWILTKAENPVAAVKSGNDAIVCGACPLRGDHGAGRACYVKVFQAPLAIWKAYQVQKRRLLGSGRG